MISILFHPEAEAELDHSICFYEERETGLGLDFQREVRRGISQIYNAPGRWPLHKYGTRKFLLNRFPFYIFYLEHSDYIWIVAVAHCSRKPNYWGKRLKG
ncbi:MAG: type II toxin-antitoxin system RelE/ParE family toxin [bacterium]|nr:type II toxin-antitoxin system RelE/ParE family toxin [bacterium]